MYFARDEVYWGSKQQAPALTSILSIIMFYVTTKNSANVSWLNLHSHLRYRMDNRTCIEYLDTLPQASPMV
jgi:hypothetical protein